MIDRLVEIASPARLSVRLDQLIIQPLVATPDADEGPQQSTSTPLSELSVLLLAHPQITLSHAVLSRIAEAGGMVVACNEKFLPAGMLLPMASHHLLTERLARQVGIRQPLRKRLWQQTVRAKIEAQGALLMHLTGDDGGLRFLAKSVRPGDPENLESQAARRYWPRIFGNPHFRRGGLGPDQNSHLDYGYTVLRAATARALCAAGLHPSLGIRHTNRYDPFCLAADIMEPFRPIVDQRVALWLRDHKAADPFDRQAKAWLLEFLAARFTADGEQRTLPDMLFRTASSLADSILKGAPMPLFPSIQWRE